MLRRCLAPSVRQILGELPETLDETYERILQEIPKSNRAHTHRLLQCLAAAIRPLFLVELAEVLAVDFSTAGGIPKLNEDLRWEDEEQAVLSACSSLVTVVANQGSRVVQFSHFSVKEFLTSDRLASKDASRYHILYEPAHTVMAQACIGVLIHLGDDIDEESISTFPLARYAADHIGDHAEFGNVLPRIQDGFDYLLDPNKPHFTAWLWLREDLSRDRSPEALPLYYVAKFGFYGLVKHLILKRPQDLSTRGPCGLPLHIALRKGHIGISRLLVDCYEDVDVRDPGDRTPLHLAAEGGFLDVIRILMKRNADINARDNRGQTPLLRASTWINYELCGTYRDDVGPLLELEADVVAQDNSHLTPPHLALSNGSAGAAKLLLDNGANVHDVDDNGQTPLHRASDSNHVDVMRLLLQHGASVDIQDNSHSTPLHLASDLGSLEAVRLLLENRANPHIRNDRGQTALHLASEWNHIERVRLLLECGADTDVQDNDHSTPLHLASCNRSLEAAQLLLEHGASVDARNNEGRMPIDLATKRGDLEMVGLLLQRVRDTDAPGKDH
jgi:ankyrin repeat protein